jgi:hypothetical protein
LSACEGFGHAVNEAMSSGCNLLLSNIQPFKQLTTQIHSVVLWTEILQTLPQTDCLGTLVDSSTISIVNALRNYVFRVNKSKKSASSLIRLTYERNHAEFVKRFGQIVEKVPDYTMASTLPKASSRRGQRFTSRRARRTPATRRPPNSAQTASRCQWMSPR